VTAERVKRQRFDVLELLEDASAGTNTLTVIESPSRRTELSFAELWRRAGAAANRLRRHIEPGMTIGAILSSSPASLAAAIGALRGGWTLASLPTPARAMDVAEYAAQLQTLCAIADVSVLVVDAHLVDAFTEMSVPTLSFQELEGPASGADLPHGGQLVQFSSGSTAQPKGIVLPLDRIGANVASTIERLEPDSDDTMCTWLPLSHDMGLIGAFLTTWAAGASLVLIAPEVFVRDPAIWMRACAESSATHTCGPNFAYAMAARAVGASGSGSLASLRVCIVGAEPIRADALRAFVEATTPLGFHERALMPAYGLAEATLCVSSIAAEEIWHTECLDRDMLGIGTRKLSDAGNTEVMSLGRPLPNMEIELAESGCDIAEVMVAGPSLLSRYLDRDVDLLDGHWLPTGDLGYLHDGELFLTGRKDDLLFVAGRNLYASDIETVSAKHPIVRAGNCVATATSDGGYVVIAEHRVGADGRQAGDAAGWIRRELSRCFGAAPKEVAIIAPGSLPKTPTGKIVRRKTASLYESGTLDRVR